MRTFHLFNRDNAAVPASMVRLLERISRSAGREDLYRKQIPGLIDQLIQRARIESVTASSEMEGVNVERPRADLIIEGQAKQLRTRNEKELAGYRDAVNYSFANPTETLSVGFICHSHRLLYSHTDARGGSLKVDDNLVIERDAQTNERVVRFVPVSAVETPQVLRGAVDIYREMKSDATLPSIVLIGALVLDFLVIHPFADGNGRVARIITNHLALQSDINVVRYVSIEKLIQESSDDYYAALLASTHGWHEGEHDPWPWLEFLAGIFASAYERFESFASDTTSGTTKQQRVREYVLKHGANTFSVREIVSALPGVSDHTVRLVLKQLQEEGSVKAESVGRNAKWLRVNRHT